MSRAHLDDALPRLTLPTLLVHGVQGRIMPPLSARNLAARLDQTELQGLPGLGHVPIATEPALVAQLSDTFGMRLSVSPVGRAVC